MQGAKLGNRGKKRQVGATALFRRPTSETAEKDLSHTPELLLELRSIVEADVAFVCVARMCLDVTGPACAKCVSECRFALNVSWSSEESEKKKKI